MVSYPQRAPSAPADAGRGKMYFSPRGAKNFLPGHSPPLHTQKGQAYKVAPNCHQSWFSLEKTNFDAKRVALCRVQDSRHPRFLGFYGTPCAAMRSARRTPILSRPYRPRMATSITTPPPHPQQGRIPPPIPRATALPPPHSESLKHGSRRMAFLRNKEHK